MALQYRTIRAVVSALLIAVALGAGGMTGVSSARAAVPPADVVFDATVTVNLPPPTQAGVSLVGAVVQLDARRADGQPFQGLEAIATDEVAVVFHDVARAASAAPDVLLDARISFAYEQPDGFGCVQRSTESGSVDGLVSADGRTIDFDTLASSTSPPDCTGVTDLTDGVVTVQFIDAGTLLPVPDAAVTITVVHPLVEGEARTVLTGTTNAKGLATIDGVPYRPNGSAEVELAISAHKDTTWTDAASGCTGSETWDAERTGIAGAAAIDVAFTLAEQLVSSSIECGPGPTPGGGVLGATGTPGIGLTPPPTDAVGIRAAAPERLGPALTIGFLIGLIASVLMLASRRGSRGRA
ncbi:MAG TPA: hypothetical protein VM427_04050 [Patescibacteria group bacterium]|nr:hypothetical protein [Patescibacteria group bacterium]